MPLNIIKSKFSRSLSSNSIASDLERLYCQDLRDIQYISKGQVPKIAQKIKSFSLDDQNLMLGQWMALLTGIPDFFVRASTFSKGLTFLRSHMDHAWNRWASLQNQSGKRYIPYEEALRVKVVDRRFYFDSYRPHFRVEVDISMGVLDRAQIRMGKIKREFAIKLPNKLLAWARKIMQESSGENAHQEISKSFLAHMEDQMQDAKEIWKSLSPQKRLEDIVMEELLQQLDRYQGDFFDHSPKGMNKISISFQYGIFALKQLRTQWVSRAKAKKGL